MEKETVLELLKTRDWLVKQIGGNYANQKIAIEIYQPQIDKIDEFLKVIIKS